MKLFVGNVDYDVTERELRDLFLPVAGVDEVIIPKGRDDRGKGFAFVKLISAEDAEGAIKQVGGMSLHGRKLRVEIAKAEQGGDRRPHIRGEASR